jgi:hypothetical protein
MKKKHRKVPKPKILQLSAERTRKKSPLARWICDVQILLNMGKTEVRRRSPQDGADRCSCAGREYRCKGCKRWRPWCEGGADDTAASEHCDRCWNEAAARSAA